MSGKAEDRLQEEANSYLKKEGAAGPKGMSPTEAKSSGKVKALIEAAVKNLNEHYVISRAAKIRKWKILDGDFSVGGGHLTPSMKLKRKVV